MLATGWGGEFRFAMAEVDVAILRALAAGVF